MKEMIKKIVIVGGGTSAWMSASYLKKKLPSIEIVVFESPSVKRIGVGEATLPNLQTAFWDEIGVPEEVWMKKVNATFKTGIKFVNWNSNPSEIDDYYYHLFGILPTVEGIPLSHYWAFKNIKEETKTRFDYSCYKESILADKMKSPISMENKKLMNYAWHFDANLVTEFLKEYSLDMGVQLVPEHVEEAILDEDGFIKGVVSNQGTKVSGDLFIDCTGFKSVLIGEVLKEPFIDMSEYLSCNSAVATQIPIDSEIKGIKPYTTATGLSAGWSWNIPLMGRTGDGYVFSDDFISFDQAIIEFSKKLNINPDKHDWNKVKFKVGMRKRPWKKNCIALGLSSNFLEPLESTGLYLTYSALNQLVKHFPKTRDEMENSNSYNNKILSSYNDCFGFIQMHYMTSSRNDTEFWRAQQNLNTSIDFMDKIKRYKSGGLMSKIKSNSKSYYKDFDLEFSNFWTDGNYYSVLTGMGVYPNEVYSEINKDKKAIERANQMFKDIKNAGKNLLEVSPSNYEYLKEFHNYKMDSKLNS